MMIEKMKHIVILAAVLLSAGAVQAHDSAATEAAEAAEALAAADTAALSVTLPPEALWDKANTAYVNADYGAAAEFYKAILAQGLVSTKLYYNLGNASFKAGAVGEAVLYYNKALRLSPSDKDIRYNLEVAEEFVKDDIDAVPEFFLATWMRTLRRSLGAAVWGVISLAALVLALSAGLVYLLSSRLRLRKTGFWCGVVSMAIFAAATAFTVVEHRAMRSSGEAIVMKPSVAVKSSPDRSATDLFILHEGTKVFQGERLDSWCEITIADGKKGWIECRAIEEI